MDDDDLTSGSLVRRWRLGKQLRQLREDAGKTMDDAARYLDLKKATISRIETGKQAILPRNVRLLCQLYEIESPTLDMLVRQAEESNERGWWVSYSDTMPPWFETYVGFEGDAASIWTYESELVPGLLQTPDYVRAVVAVAPLADAERAIQFRLARQERLATRPPEMRVVLNEGVLRRAPVAAQVRYLLEQSERDYLDLRVLPFDAGLHRSTRGPFSVLTLPGETEPSFVYLEHLDGALYLERPADLRKYVNVLDDVRERALSPEATRDWLTTLVSE